MAALFFPLFAFFFFLLTPLNDSIIKINRHVRELAEIDRELGDSAESMSDWINAALALNAGLMTLYVACPAAKVSGTVPVIKASGELIRMQQEFFLAQAQLIKIKNSAKLYRSKFNKPRRHEAGLCEIPGTLYCPETLVFEFKSIDGSKPAGVKGESSTCTVVHWKYEDSRVMRLK